MTHFLKYVQSDESLCSEYITLDMLQVSSINISFNECGGATLGVGAPSHMRSLHP
jgi:hypothetical protein